MSLEEAHAEVASSIKHVHGIRELRVVKATSADDAKAAELGRRFEGCRGRLHEPSLVLRLYFVAPPAALRRALHEGFEAVAPDAHDFGRGWYFSRYASRAHHLSGGAGALLLAAVAVGNTETVVRRDGRRGAPSEEGFDSIVVPGRALPHAGAAASAGCSEEYVIFDGSQALPLALIEYDEAVEA